MPRILSILILQRKASVQIASSAVRRFLTRTVIIRYNSHNGYVIDRIIRRLHS